MSNEKFEAAYIAATEPFPIHPNIRIWEAYVLFELRESGHNEWYLDGITTQEDFRMEGYGTLAMEWLCKLADEFEITLVGEIRPQAARDEGPNKIQLRRWYRKLGFACDIDYRIIRLPKDLP